MIVDCCYISRFGTTTAIICSPDAYILVLSVAFQEKHSSNIWFETVVKRETRYIPVYAVAKKFGINLFSQLLPYALLGCEQYKRFRG